MKYLFPLILVGLLNSLGAQTLSQAQDLYEAENYQAAYSLLEKALPQSVGNERALILTELSKNIVKLGGQMKKSGASQVALLSHYEKGEAYAKEAISLNPNLAQAWYWKSSNVGRWGQTKGVLDSLFKASSMKADLEQVLKLDPDMADAYYVLGILFEALPGWPVSFGNVSWAVSLGRKALSAMDKEISQGKLKEPIFDYSLELAKHLWARNWDAGKRSSEQGYLKSEYAKASTPLDRGCWFESQVNLSAQSDRQEALELVKRTVTALQATGLSKVSWVDDLASAKKLLGEWK